jgi:hypothetical protein
MVFVPVIKHSFCYEAKFSALMLSFHRTSLRNLFPYNAALREPNIEKSHGAVPRCVEVVLAPTYVQDITVNNPFILGITGLLDFIHRPVFFHN